MSAAERTHEIPDLRVRAFPRDEEVWRVSWIGRVDYPDRSERSNQPSVGVWLSRIVDRARSTDDEWLIGPDSTDHRTRVMRWVAVGTLVILRVGDLWSARQLVARPSYQTEEFRDLDVSPESLRVVKAGVSLSGQSFVIPAEEHPWHMSSTHSYCSLVALEDGRSILVPALELVRFYFG